MFIVILIALAGMAVGYALRRIRLLQHVHTTITLTICFMLFVLGLSVGENADIVHNLWRYGGQALLISVASVVGSAVAGALLYRFIFRGHLSNTSEK